MKKDKIILHRGFHNKNQSIPENSLLAFQIAADLGFDVELDVRLTKDNTVIVFHDSNTFRMTGKSKRIKDCTYSELKSLRLAKSNQFIPTLLDVLKVISGKVKVFIEIKGNFRTRLLEKQIAKILDNYKGYFVIVSFLPSDIIWFLWNRPNYKRGLLVNFGFSKLFTLSKFCLFLIKPNFLLINKFLINEKISFNKNHIVVWTIKDSEEFKRLKNKNYYYIIDGFIP